MLMDSKGYGFVSFIDMQDAFRFLEVGPVFSLRRFSAASVDQPVSLVISGRQATVHEVVAFLAVFTAVSSFQGMMGPVLCSNLVWTAAHSHIYLSSGCLPRPVASYCFYLVVCFLCVCFSA